MPPARLREYSDTVSVLHNRDQEAKGAGQLRHSVGRAEAPRPDPPPGIMLSGASQETRDLDGHARAAFESSSSLPSQKC